MSCYGFSEIHDFDLDQFIPYMGWIGAKLVKIYTREDTDYFYLHDETAGRLFEFQFGAASDEKAKFRYDHVVDDYRDWKQSLPLDNSDIGNIP